MEGLFFVLKCEKTVSLPMCIHTSVRLKILPSHSKLFKAEKLITKLYLDSLDVGLKKRSQDSGDYEFLKIYIQVIDILWVDMHDLISPFKKIIRFFKKKTTTFKSISRHRVYAIVTFRLF